MTNKTGRTWDKACALAGVLLAAGAVLPACAGTTPAVVEADQPLREVQQARYFTGSDGMHVEALDFADGSALVQVLGVESELSGRVLAYQRVQNGGRMEYQTKWHGRDLYALVKERDGGWVAYVPGAQHGFTLGYDEAKSKTVDGNSMQRLHQTQSKTGELDVLQRFDRAAEQHHAEEELATASQRTGAQCGKPVPVAVRWSSLSDAQLLELSVSGYCESVLSALNHLCDAEAGKRFVAQHVSAAECALDGDNSLKLHGQTLSWSINAQITNADQRAYAALLALQPDSTARSLEQQILSERTAVCADAEQKHVILLGPREAAHQGMAYGDGQQFVHVRTPEQLGDGWFFDPRQRNEQNNDNFRGLDLRLFSHIEPDAKTGICKLTCGTRETSLVMVNGPAKDNLLAAASYAPSPNTREPYALARDKAGTYYFVDRGATEQTARDFRLYKGPRGKLRPLAMKDVVSDSEGEIFASTSGKLRLVLGKQSAQWIASSTSTLLLLPLSENYGLIYNELGVYLSQKLGVPCDDL